MSGPYDTEHPEQTQRPAWGSGGERPTEGQQGTEGGASSGSTWNSSQQPSWGYDGQFGGSGAGWGYAPPPFSPSRPRSTSRPLPGSADEQATQGAQGWSGGYAGGYYGPPSQSLQPFQPPQPPYGAYGGYGYGQDSAASGGWGAYSGGAYGGGYGAYGSYGPASGYGGYGQYGPPSQQGGYGPYGEYGQWGAPSQWGPPIAIEAPAKPPWSMRRKLAVIGGVVALILVLACGGLGYMQYNAPTFAANQICSDFQSQRYVDAYGLFDAQLQTQMTSVQFAQAALDLDRAEGQTVKCEATVHANGFSDSSTAATLMLTRPNANGLQGEANLKKEGGSWKVTALDQSLFGVDLRALNTVDSYCTALLSQTYDAAYTMLDKAQQNKQKSVDFRREAGWRDEIDGNATACHAAAIGANTGSTASMTLSVTRSRAGEHQGTIALAVEGTAWKVHSVADEALGSDIGPIRTATRFCNDLASRNYGDILPLVVGLFTVDQVRSSFYSTAYDIALTNCTLDLSTYKVTGSSATLTATFTVEQISTGNTGSAPLKIKFTKVGHDWKIEGFDKAA